VNNVFVLKKQVLKMEVTQKVINAFYNPATGLTRNIARLKEKNPELYSIYSPDFGSEYRIVPEEKSTTTQERITRV
jgi:hypothetical protein